MGEKGREDGVMVVKVVVVVRGWRRMFRRRVVAHGGVSGTTLGTEVLRLRRRGGGVRQAVVARKACVVGVLMAVMGREPPDVAPSGFKEAQLRVVEDVEVRAAQAVTCGSDEKVPVVFTALPPHGEVERAAAKLETR